MVTVTALHFWQSAGLQNLAGSQKQNPERPRLQELLVQSGWGCQKASELQPGEWTPGLQNLLSQVSSWPGTQKALHCHPKSRLVAPGAPRLHLQALPVWPAAESVFCISKKPHGCMQTLQGKQPLALRCQHQACPVSNKRLARFHIFGQRLCGQSHQDRLP